MDQWMQGNKDGVFDNSVWYRKDGLPLVEAGVVKLIGGQWGIYPGSMYEFYVDSWEERLARMGEERYPDRLTAMAACRLIYG